MEIKDQLAFPYHTSTLTQLTKREYFAAMAMQGLIASNFYKEHPFEWTAGAAIRYADVLMEELNKPEHEVQFTERLEGLDY